MSSLKPLALALLCAYGTAALAEEGAAQRIKNLNQQAAVLNAELAVETLRAQVSAKKAEIAKAEGSRPPSAAAGTPRDGGELPVVTAIEKAGEKRLATLRYRSGTDRIVSEGAKADAWDVKKITSQEVWLTSGRETVRLSVGSDSGGYVAGAGVGVPGGSSPGLPAPPVR